MTYLNNLTTVPNKVNLSGKLLFSWNDFNIEYHNLKNNIPEELLVLPQWVCWRVEVRDGKPSKPPVNPKTGGYAKVDDPETWGEFEQAKRYWQAHKDNGIAGVGFVFSEADPYCGIDLDKCQVPETGVIEPWARDIIKRLNSYSEISPSGRGVHILVKGKLPPGARRKVRVEMYDSGHYFTMSGLHLDGNPATIKDRQAELEAFHAEIFPLASALKTQGGEGNPAPGATLTDEELLERAFRAKNGEKFRKLWEGDYSDHDSPSEADLALCRILAFWTGNEPERIDRLFRRSELMRPKWDERHSADGQTYGQMTIVKALNSQFGGQAQTETSPGLTHGQEMWPPSLRPEAFHGLAGEFVNLVLPHTEADPAALLTQFLAVFGNMAGRNIYFQVEGTRHYPRINVCLVGETSKSRKGTSFDHVENRARKIDPQWANDKNISGLGSGEALIWQVRDPNAEAEDPGVTDKRLLVAEPEFAAILRVMGRKESILSNIIRCAWDDKPLRNTVKTSPARATEAHISIIGHITQDELRRHLTESDMANGFGNRFLWICVRRSKLLPEGGRIQEVDFTDFDCRFSEAVEFAREESEIKRDEGARALWIEIYPALSEGRPGLLGALTARSEAQVVRLSLIFALLDNSPMIRREHLEAALAVWDYAEASVRCIFGDATGYPDADRILEALKETPQGLSQTEISRLFQGNISADRLRKALGYLEKHGVIQGEKLPSEKGRPSTLWRLIS